MSVTGAPPAQREEYFRQIERLVSSGVLHGSESLCKLLRYLAEQTVDHPGAAVKEYQIATEVFGRPGNFDPRLDSTVRVQTGRLRSKLAEYYAGAGAEDPLIVEMPKGVYALSFHPRPASQAGTAVSHAAEQAGETVLRPALRFWRAVTIVLVVLLAGSLVALTYSLTTRGTPASAKVSPAENPAPYRRFWKNFIDQPDEPWVIFSNAEFVGRPETGMRYFDGASDSRTQILDHYTGVGEVLAVHELDRVFTVLQHGLRVKRGHLLSLDDAKNNNLIFVGSPSENLTLREIPSTQDFVFKRTDTPTRKGDLAIVNLRPKAGEQKVYFASPAMPLTEDYSLVALVPGLNQARWAMILAGTTTLGTEAAVEYVCRARSIEDLLTRLTGSRTGDVTPFEAVVRVKVSGGVPVQSELVALHGTR